MRARLVSIRKLVPLIGVGILVVIVARMDLGRFLSILRGCDGTYLVLAILLIPLIVLLMTCRWMVVLAALGIGCRLVHAFGSLVKGTLFGEITPARMGELLRAEFLSSHVDAGATGLLCSVVIDRLYDMIVLAVFVAGAAVAVFGPEGAHVLLFWLLFVSAGTLAASVALLNERFVRVALAPASKFLVPSRHSDRVAAKLEEICRNLKAMALRAGASCIGLSVVLWVAKFMSVFMLARALGIDVGFTYIMSVAAVGIAVSLVPISVSGLGTRDAVFVALLSVKGASTELAVALSFMYLALGIFGVVIPGACVYLFEFAISRRTIRAVDT